ncbi:response regulator [Zobellia laminariae]|uniref:response regulator n=1 Tax=Zobellia laminariae TaxID=248906 RepID=UPI0012D8E228|nr:response regulator [Zobellia laminariae]MUH40755.1 response regulator [Zobellia laminariae]WKX76039.1 response regulator [Zobellia laminariae]
MQNPFHLCIVDDDDIYRFTIIQSAKFSKIEHMTSVFPNGEEAINYIKKNQDTPDALPNLILLDIDMPIMDGFQFLKAYKEIETKLSKKIAIYMVSSSVDPEDIEKAKGYTSVIDYLSKPLKSDKLKAIIERTLEG